MSNMPDVTKRVLSVMVPRDLYYQLKQEAHNHKLDMSTYVRLILSESVIDVDLTQENLEKIKKEIKNAKAKRNKS